MTSHSRTDPDYDGLSGQERGWLEERILETILAAKLTRSCISCYHFDEEREVCQLNGVNQRPPARIIVLGCSKFSPDIPF